MNTRPCFEEKCEGESRTLTLGEAKSWLDNIESKDYGVMVVAMNKLYERGIFEDLRYPEGKLHEDTFVIFKLLEMASSINYISDVLYNYTIRNDSITGSDNRLDIRHLDILEAYETNLVHEIEIGDTLEAEILWKKFLSWSIYYIDLFKTINPEVCLQLKANYKRVYYKYKGCAALNRKVKYWVLMLRL